MLSDTSFKKEVFTDDVTIVYYISVSEEDNLE